MIKRTALVLFLLLVFTAKVFAQGGAANRVRSAASLPSTCSAGTATTPVDIVFVGTVEYRCGPVDNQWLPLSSFRGPNPWADIRAFGALNFNAGGVPTTTANCLEGSTTITTSAPFSNGWGMTIYGCGRAVILRMPKAPTISPNLATSGTVTSPGQVNLLVASPRGGSTYSYRSVAADQHGGLSLPSPTATITNGLLHLGMNRCTVTTMSRSGATITVNTSSCTGGAQNLAVGAMIHLSGSSNAQFSGWFNAATVNNARNSFTITNTGLDTRLRDASSATGGQVAYATANHIWLDSVPGTWKNYVCAERPGDFSWKVIGVTVPTQQTGNQAPGNSFFDYGPTLLGNQNFPSYITPAICTATSPTNDYLTTTVKSGGGTNTIVVANVASQNVTGAKAVFDDVPAILAAANSSNYTSPGYTGGTVFIPPVVPGGGVQAYIINSYLKLPTNTKLLQAGPLAVFDTLELPTPVNWDGSWAAVSGGGFGFNTSAGVYCYAVSPCIYTNGLANSLFEHLSVSSSGTNGGLLWLSDDTYQATWSYDTFDSNADNAGDLIGMDMMFRATGSGGNPLHFDHVYWSGGPNQVTDSTWAPLVYMPENLLGAGGAAGTHVFADMKAVFFNRRGALLEADGGNLGLWDVDWCYRQGGITPLFSLYNSSGVIFGQMNLKNCEQDTETSSTVALLTAPLQGNDMYIHLDQIENSSGEVGGVPPAVTGQRPFSVIYSQSDVAKSDGLGAMTIDAVGFHSFLMQYPPGAFALLPACSSAGEGTHAEVMDSTTNSLGATITGGGTYKVAARCDGTNWTVEAASGVAGTGMTRVCFVAITMPTVSIAIGAKSSSVTGICRGLAPSTDAVSCTPTSEPFAVSGFRPSTKGILEPSVWMTANSIHAEYENNTGAVVTPGALTINCVGMR